MVDVSKNDQDRKQNQEREAGLPRHDRRNYSEGRSKEDEDDEVRWDRGYRSESANLSLLRTDDKRNSCEYEGQQAIDERSFKDYLSISPRRNAGKGACQLSLTYSTINQPCCFYLLRAEHVPRVNNYLQARCQSPEVGSACLSVL